MHTDTDLLRQLLAMVRAELPDVPDKTWRYIDAHLRGVHGGQRGYIASHPKSDRIARLEAALETDPQVTAERISQLLGVGVRQARRYLKGR